jgi:hypothetical protein
LKNLAEISTTESPRIAPAHHASHHDLHHKKNTPTPPGLSKTAPNPYCYQRIAFIFHVFSPEIACQAPKPLNRFRIRNIRMAR